jgi:flagellar assembly factor FliW
MEENVLEFEDGIPGFPDAHRFQLVELVEDGAFQLLRSVDDPDLAIVVGVPWLFFSDYAPELTDVDQAGLEIESESDAVVFCAVTLDSDRKTAHMNLLGPFVVNARTRKGRQVVLTEQDYPIRAQLPVGLS